MDATTKTVSTLQGLPFNNLIGGPLNACILAQAEAAQTTVNFIQDVGLSQQEDGSMEAVYVYFNFVQNGRKATVSVPLLTILPIPYIAINTVDINFKATVNGLESESLASNASSEKNVDYNYNSKGWFKKAPLSCRPPTPPSATRRAPATPRSAWRPPST